ncbi:hypothetical protein DAI22_11g219700 [Oryza sativa Japonica Group]|nr:hypothetical protein DAI22_11g219700 [Oryza sativa Japonica Group]
MPSSSGSSEGSHRRSGQPEWRWREPASQKTSKVDITVPPRLGWPRRADANAVARHTAAVVEKNDISS